MLSSLWKRQHSLVDLVRVQPNRVQDEEGEWPNLPVNRIRYQFLQVIEGGPLALAKDWARLRRQTSWIRELYLRPDRNMADDILIVEKL